MDADMDPPETAADSRAMGEVPLAEPPIVDLAGAGEGAPRDGARE